MKTKMITLVIMLLCASMIKAQYNNPFGFNCAITGEPGALNNPVLPGGIYKPESIEKYTTAPEAYFPVLVVYVQFLDDPGPDWQDCPWHRNQAPNFFNTVIATSKASGYGDEWWNAYNENTKTLSDYWMEVSRGKFHIVGQEVNVVLPRRKDYYEQFGSNCKAYAMEDLFTALQNNEEINWLNFDLWSKVNNTFIYGQRDGYVDMLYIVARSNPCSSYFTGSLGGYFRPNGVRDLCIHNGIQTDEHIVYNHGGVEIKLKANFSETRFRLSDFTRPWRE